MFECPFQVMLMQSETNQCQASEQNPFWTPLALQSRKSTEGFSRAEQYEWKQLVDVSECNIVKNIKTL